MKILKALNLIKNKIKESEKLSIDTSKSGLIYFCTWEKDYSYYYLKLILGEIKYTGLFIYKILKDIFYIRNFSFNINRKKKKFYKKLFILWNDNSIITKKNIDRYTKKKFDSNYLYLIQTSNLKFSHINKEVINNVFVVKNKKKFSLNQLINFFLKLKKKNFYKLRFLFHFYNSHNFLGLFYYENLDKLLKKVNSIKEIHLIYESQPFQNYMIHYLRENYPYIKIYGHVTSKNPFPVNFFKKKYFPNKLFLYHRDQVSIFTKFLGWNKNEIVYQDSLNNINNKFDKNKNHIFLSFSIMNYKLYIKCLKKILNEMPYTELSLVKIHNHPVMTHSKIHLKMIKKISNIIYARKLKEKLYKHKNTSPKFKKHIFLGSTSMILNSVNNKNIEVLQIFENSLLETYDKVLWPSLKIKLLDKNIAQYNKNFLK